MRGELGGGWGGGHTLMSITPSTDLPLSLPHSNQPGDLPATRHAPLCHCGEPGTHRVCDGEQRGAAAGLPGRDAERVHFETGHNQVHAPTLCVCGGCV